MTKRAMKTKNPAILETTAAIVKFDTEIFDPAPLALVTVLFVEPIIEGWECVEN